MCVFFQGHMFTLDTSNFPITFLHLQPNKDDNSYIESIQNMEKLLDFAIQEEAKIKLIVVGNLNMAIPPLRLWRQVITDVKRLFPAKSQGLEKTAIWKPDNKMDLLFKMLFKVYTPSRPLKMFTNYDDAVAWLNSESEI